MLEPSQRVPGQKEGAWHNNGPSYRCAPTFCANAFSFTLLSKNASASHLVSHSCKNKGLKVPCFHTLTKNIGGREYPIHVSNLEPPPSNLRLYHESPITNHKSLRLSPLTSALTSKRASKSFRCNTYEKHTGGEGVLTEFRVSRFEFRFSSNCRLSTHESPITSHESRH